MLALGALPALAVNLITNGSFESPDIGLPPAGFNYTNVVTGWTVIGNPTVLFNTTYRPVSDLLQAVQIERNGDQLQQSFATVIGQQYLLSFDLSSWWTSGPPAQPGELGVTVGPASGSYTESTNAYTTYTLPFTATAITTTLTFTNTGPTGNSYPQIDDVSVTAVPEPGTVAMLLAGLAAVGFMAKRRSA